MRTGVPLDRVRQGVPCPLLRPTPPRLEDWAVHWRRLPQCARDPELRDGFPLVRVEDRFSRVPVIDGFPRVRVDGAARVRARTGRITDQRGSATVLVLVAVVLLAAATLVGLVLGALATLERRVESAADLAALAGAAAVQDAADGCAAARVVAARNDASLGACAVRGDVLEVRAVRVVHLPLVGRVPLAARARAGPSGLRAR
jgi:secretion/DNA translocation related TadE-like protein